MAASLLRATRGIEIFVWILEKTETPLCLKNPAHGHIDLTHVDFPFIERLRESSEPRLAKIHRLIFKEPITEPDLAMAESLASVLRTSIDDDYVITIVLNNRARLMNMEILKLYYSECKFADRMTFITAAVCLLLFAFIAHHVAAIENVETRILSLISAVMDRAKN